MSDESVIIESIKKLIINAPLEEHIVQDENHITVTSTYSWQIVAGSHNFTLAEIDYEKEIYHHLVLASEDFEVCVTRYAFGTSRYNKDILEIISGTTEQVLEAITLIALTHSEYFK